ncbi:MAG: integrase [Planctomycetota bacterium]|nr:MAG: integrase [Planctomycetota bacterium]
MQQFLVPDVIHTSSLIDRVPAVIAHAGPEAARAFLEFFTASIRNPHTRAVYARACTEFLNWCAERKLLLQDVEPIVVAAYIEELGTSRSATSVKVSLAAIRMLFDHLATRHVVTVNPARSVRGPRVQRVEGSTPAFDVRQARTLLDSIDITTVAGLRDRALVATLVYTAARIGAVCRLRVKDFAPDGTQWCLHFTEKGGKQRRIPCRHDLERCLREYIEAAQIGQERESSLFRSLARTRFPTARGLNRVEAHAMLKRRLKRAGLPGNLSCHSFRATTATDPLDQGVPLEDVQYLLGHADPRTTRLYDRRMKQVTRNIVERISV